MANSMFKRSVAVTFPLVVTLTIVLLTLPPTSNTPHWKATTQLRQQITSFIFPPTVVCPSIPNGPLPISHAHQTCTSLASVHPEFNLRLCYQPTTCNAFTLRIQRTSEDECREAESSPDLSTDSLLNEWIRNDRGPDAFSVRTDGAERLTTTWSAYEGDCSYRFEIALRNPGPIYLEAWQTFQHYEAFKETNHSWPEMLYSPLMSGPVELALCSSDCTMVTAKPTLVNNKTLVKISSNNDVISTASLPGCAGSAPIPGSFLPVHPLDLLYPPYRLTGVDGTSVGGRYKFFPEGCEWKHAAVRYGDPAKCTKAKKTRVQVVGDSHGRVIHDGLVNRLEGHNEPLLKSAKSGSKQSTIDGTSLSFLWDPRAKLLLSQFSRVNCTLLFDDVDAFVLVTGAHYAVDDTTQNYLAFLSLMFNLPLPGGFCDLSKSGKPLPKLIFVTAPAQPPRQDNFVRKFGDHRTNVRLGYWAQEATKLALGLGWEVVDQYALTMPHMMAPMRTDGAHYLMTDALDPILDEVIGKTGICLEEAQAENVVPALGCDGPGCE